MTDEQKAPLPIWAKVLLGFFVAGVVLWLAIGAYCAYWIGNLQKAATDPAAISATMRHVAHMDQLPPDFQPSAGFSLDAAHIYLVLFRHVPDDSEFWLMRMPDPSGQSARQIVDRGAEMASQGKGTRMSVAQRGTETVGGEEMDWVEGPVTAASGKAAHQMVGVIVLKNKHESIRFIGITPGDKFDAGSAHKLLAAIKGF